jgi:alpha-D-xyloside xylohydrolase
VLDESGEVEFYLPAGRWTDHWTGAVVDGGGWRRETHGFDTLPLYVREGAVLPWGARTDRSDYDYLDGLELEVFPGGNGVRTVTVTTPGGATAAFTVERTDGAIAIASTHEGAWSARRAGTTSTVEANAGRASL